MNEHDVFTRDANNRGSHDGGGGADHAQPYRSGHASLGETEAELETIEAETDRLTAQLEALRAQQTLAAAFEATCGLDEELWIDIPLYSPSQ
jgi:hypothetical protein